MNAISNRPLARAVTRTLGSSAAIGVALLCVTNVQAQQDTQANTDQLETVVVTGIRAGIEEAIELKRGSGSIVEAISAEDIGKLPDTSIADSLSRLPGLTSQRAEGRASAISLRGTDPGFTTALLNGREQVSTGDNRSIEFDQYPSELLSAVVVYKTPDAQLVGQGLAGTIDLRTTRPLDVSQRAIVMNVRGEMNSQDDMGADADEMGYRASFSYIDQFLDNTLGVTFGFAHLESPLAIQGAGTYEPWHANDPEVDEFNYHPEVANGLFVTNGMKIRADMGENRRDGAMAAIQWRPSESYETVLDLYYTRRKQIDNARSLEVNLGNYPIEGVGFANPIIADNTVVGGDLLNRVPLARNFLFKTEDEIFATGWNHKWFAGVWTFIADASYSKAERDEEQYETNGQYVLGGTSNIPDSGFFSLSRHDMPTLNFNLDYADPNAVRLGPTIYGAGYTKIPHVEDELKSARFDVVRELGGFLSDVSVGFNYSDRTKDKVQPEANLSTRDGAYYQVGGEHLLAPTNLGYANANRTLAWDVLGVLGAYYNPIVYGRPDDPDFAYLVGKNWKVSEEVTTAYVKGNLDHDLSSSVTLRGNLGVQVVQTDQSSDALRLRNGVATPYSDGKDYTDVLPAINLAFMLPAEQAIRVGVAKEIARARMDQLKASSEIGYDAATGQPGGSGGNPRLDPWRAYAYDISYERYFGPNAYVSLAGFYKDLRTYIYAQTTADFDFSELLASLPPEYFENVPPGTSIPTTGRFTEPVNGEGGNLKGLELSVALTGELFTEALTGFGTLLSVSRTESSITIEDPPNNQFTGGNGLGTIPLPGLSKTVWNATVYYENAGFSARVATRSRSEYIGEVTNFANDRAFKYVQGDQITDAQLGYEFGAGALQGLSILLQVNNLTNEPYIAYSVVESRQQDFQQYGRQYLLGINYRL
ncbi:TonB-dependent receptor [Steroidobacter sp. S1-65]|uniref:TonB-dependent receptor n=1 Tax=Steroidobacter gossypii TaxID=2805490 RepID=A0ABS1X1S4_9GAMM|nr:TonB-dependent receptor [Steroidobacter gossypii]MBM0107195.1 TonB-dependent receptor [Steroidobacter gossypii]